MANISKVVFSKSIPLNFSATNRITSTFFVVGGPIEPGGYSLIRDDVTGKYVLLDLTPKFEGQLIYSNTVDSNYEPIQFAARLFISVPKETPDNKNKYKWVPIINYYADSYLDPTTGKEWDPVATYVCDPPYLCPET